MHNHCWAQSQLMRLRTASQCDEILKWRFAETNKDTKHMTAFMAICPFRSMQLPLNYLNSFYLNVFICIYTMTDYYSFFYDFTNPTPTSFCSMLILKAYRGCEEYVYLIKNSVAWNKLLLHCWDCDLTFLALLWLSYLLDVTLADCFYYTMYLSAFGTSWLGSSAPKIFDRTNVKSFTSDLLLLHLEILPMYFKQALLSLCLHASLLLAVSNSQIVVAII
jgi:hypothetical protein